MRLADESISRRHAALSFEHGGLRVVNLGSKNGLYLEANRVFDAVLTGGETLRVVQTALRVEHLGESRSVATTERTSFGKLVGARPEIRRLTRCSEARRDRHRGHSRRGDRHRQRGARRIAARDGAAEGPVLFRAALCDVPLTDMVRFISREKGRPRSSARRRTNPTFARSAYSPYHRVRRGVRYPAVLITTGAHDDRGNPMHAQKFAAALQAATTGEDVLLRVEWNAGHHGSDLASIEALKNADVLAFLLAATKAR